MESFLAQAEIIIDKYPFLKTVIASLLLVLILQITKKVILSSFGKNVSRETSFFRKKIGQYLNYFTVLLLFLIWFSQLQVFLVSLFAIAAAIVVALKELIMCLTGGLLLRSSKSFREGQRIEIAKVRGFVLETKLLTTKVLEIGPEDNSQQTTGNIISIPNSLLLSNPVKNESYFNSYSIKSYQFQIGELQRVQQFEELILEKCREICSSYLESAKKNISRFCEREGIDIPSLEPRTKILFDEKCEKAIVMIKMPVKHSSIADTEQVLNRLFLDWKAGATV